MAAVYSALLARSPGLGPGLTTLATVPSGFVWVVRTVSFFNFSYPWQGLEGILLQDSLQCPIVGLGRYEARPYQPYDRTVHHALEPGDELVASCLDNDWRIRISGYQLTLP